MNQEKEGKKIKAKKVTCKVYRSIYYEQNKGTKTVKCEFTILPYKRNTFMAYVHSVDTHKGIKHEFKGNLLWGFGNPLPIDLLNEKLHSYTNLDEIKRDFSL